MRSLWFALLLALPCLAASARAGEVIASSGVRQPIAASAGTPFAPPPPTASIQQAAYLAPPRVIRGAAPSPSGLMPLEASPVPALARVPAASMPGFSAVLRPEPALKPAFPAQEARQSLFAIDRTGFAAMPAALVFASGPETLAAMPTKGVIPAPAAPPAEVIYDDGYGSDPAFRLYGSAEYLMWWTKDASIPVLASTSRNPFDNGILGAPTTRVLFGGELDRDLQSGARFRLGYWFGDEKQVALEGSYFFLGSRSDGFAANSRSTPLIARPFFDLNNRMESSEVVAFPGQVAGSLLIDAPSSLSGADLNLRCQLCCGNSCAGNWKVDALAGFRFLNLREGLYIQEQGMDIVDQGNPDVAFLINDRFDTANRFYGGQAGLASEFKSGRWSVGARGTLALGVTRQVININGSALFLNRDGSTSALPGGLLALSSNSGRFTKNRFAVAPEIGVTLGYEVTDWMKLTAGYNFLFWSSVVRPGDQIDRNLDIRQIPRFAPPGTPLPLRPGPLVPFKDTTYWAQGMTLGMELTY